MKDPSDKNVSAEWTDGSGRQGKKTIMRYMLRILILAAMIWVITFKVFGFCIASGEAMGHSIMDGDLVLFLRVPMPEYSYGDVVAYEAGGRLRFGRIVACPGDLISLSEDGMVLINGFLPESERAVGIAQINVMTGPQESSPLPKGSYYLLNDNREIEEDSRIFGKIEKKSILGKVLCLYRHRSI